MTTGDLLIHFEQVYNKAKNYKMEIHDGVSANQLLSNAKLLDSNKQLIKPTLTEMRYSSMKDQLHKVFARTSLSLQQG